MALEATSGPRRTDAFAVFLLGAIAFALPWDAFQRIPYVPLTAVKIAGGFVVVLAAARWVSDRRGLPRIGLEWPLLLFAVGCLVSTATADAPAASAQPLTLLAAYGAFVYAGVLFVRSPAMGRRLLQTYYVAAVGVAVVTFFCKAGVLWPTDWKPTAFPYGGSLLELARSGAPMRMVAASPDLNQGALLLAVAYAVGLFVWHGPMGLGGRIVLMASRIALIGAIIVAQSRSALAAVAIVTLLVLGVGFYQRSRAAVIALGIGCVVAAGALWQWAPAKDWLLREDDSVSARTWAYRAAWELLPEHWLTGVGLDASRRAIAESRFGPEVDGMAIHNVPLKLGLETGVLGFAGYTLFWVVVVVTLGRVALRGDRSEVRALARAGLAAAFVVGCMQMVQPFVALPVYPFLLAAVLGPLSAAQRAGVADTARGGGRLVWLGAAGTAVLVLVNQWGYQQRFDGVVTYVDNLTYAAESHAAGRWDEAEALLDRTGAVEDSLNGNMAPLTFSPLFDVAASVADMAYAHRRWDILFESMHPAGAVLYAKASLALSRGARDEAERLLGQIDSLEPYFSQGNFLRGEISRAYEARDDALASYQRAAVYGARWENWRFRERMDVVDARIAALEGSEDPVDQAELQYWKLKRGLASE